jgi:hypothetical protein
VTRWIHSLVLVAGLMPFGVLAQNEHPLPDPTTPSGALQYDAPIANSGENKPPIPSFLKRDPNKAGGPANELNTGDARASERLPGGDAAGAATGATLYHGNFCGLGNRGDDLLSTDPLDEACKRHDECFDRTNRACSCNESLRQDAYRVSELKTASRELRARAANVVLAAPAIECRGP